MGKSKAFLAATAVASLPIVTLGAPTHAFASTGATTTRATWQNIPAFVPRGGGGDNDKDPPPATKSRSSNSKRSSGGGGKKKRIKKKTAKKEQQESSSSSTSQAGHDREKKEDVNTTRTPQAPQQEPQAPSEDKPNSQPSGATPDEVPKTLPVVEEILKEDDYYRILGVARTSTPTEIKKSYRRKALLTHPDKTNGDRRAFDKVAEAYEILSDESKRKIYDRHGKKGLDGAGPGHGFATAEDLFRSFFGGAGGRGPYQQPRRNRTARYQLDVTLEDLYNGLIRNVAVAPPDGRATSKQVQVNVPRGALSGQSIRLHGAMDFDPEDTPGDLVFSLHQRPHRQFTRKGHDLAVITSIGLDEALNGTTRTIRHLDGRSLTIASARNAPMIQTGDVQVLKGQGMPKNAMGTEFGDLYVQYRVELPKPNAATSRLTAEEREELGRLLRKMEGRAEPDVPTSDVQYLQPARPSDFGTASGTPEIPRDEEEDEGGHFSGNPFGNGRSSFYYSSGFGGGGSPFFGMNPEDLFRGESQTGDENAQECRTM